MILEFRKPQGELGAYITLMVYHEGYQPAHQIDRFLPDGSVDLVINLADEDLYVFDNRSLQPTQRCRKSWISGIRTESISISAGTGAAMFVMSFRAAGARPFFHVPANELTNRVVDAEVVIGSDIVDFRNQLLAKSTAHDKFRTAEMWLRRRLLPQKNGYELAAFASDVISRSPQLATVDAVAEGANVSCKHLISVFRDYIGITPKQYQRVSRFQRAVSMIDNTRRMDWAQIALENGFYDQSHLIREFKHFSGMTPSAYRQAKGADPNYIPVA